MSTKLFKNGQNQAVRIPKRWSFDCEAVTMTRRGDSLVIRPKKDDWSELEDLASEFDDDFMRHEVRDLHADDAVRFE
ncbi:MAG: AbrB/MazE/SpoVT family DNA-binding domain-containing protein [Verrucomicrobia bacterium]|nr:AbrB/MazE/SpoVT family DNA-binding domain-containing protein [Verrucomicrobiota bacterium]